MELSFYFSSKHYTLRIPSNKAFH